MATSIARALAIAIRPRTGLRLPQPERYSGRADYNLYRLHFDNLANLHEWDCATRGRMLSTSLGDDALVVLNSLPPHLCNDYAALDAALSKRFGVAPLEPREYRCLLGECRQQHEESLNSFALRIDELVRKAHPTLDRATQEQYMVETFVYGLLDSMVARLVNFSNSQTLDGALAAAKCFTPKPNQPHTSQSKKVGASEN